MVSLFVIKAFLHHTDIVRIDDILVQVMFIRGRFRLLNLATQIDREIEKGMNESMHAKGGLEDGGREDSTGATTNEDDDLSSLESFSAEMATTVFIHEFDVRGQ